MNWYAVSFEHDRGKFTLTLSAPTIAAALELALKRERAPMSAVLSVQKKGGPYA